MGTDKARRKDTPAGFLKRASIGSLAYSVIVAVASMFIIGPDAPFITGLLTGCLLSMCKTAFWQRLPIWLAKDSAPAQAYAYRDSPATTAQAGIKQLPDPSKNRPGKAGFLNLVKHVTVSTGVLLITGTLLVTAAFLDAHLFNGIWLGLLSSVPGVLFAFFTSSGN
jgi:hypothetical protein